MLHYKHFDVAKDVYNTLFASNFDPISVNNLKTRYRLSDQDIQYLYLIFSYYKGAKLDETAMKIMDLFSSLDNEGSKMSLKDALDKAIFYINEEAIAMIVKNKQKAIAE